LPCSFLPVPSALASGGDGRQILRSIANKLLPLPEDTVVIPGHGDATTIGREKKRNPFLRGL
jgi:glyoxylase-like metal-dependent hydrolase (beta-lactamase superfamily II)